MKMATRVPVFRFQKHFTLENCGLQLLDSLLLVEVLAESQNLLYGLSVGFGLRNCGGSGSLALWQYCYSLLLVHRGD